MQGLGLTPGLVPLSREGFGLLAQPGITSAISRVDLLKECSLARVGERVLPPAETSVRLAMALLAMGGVEGPLHAVYRPQVRVERIASRIRDVGGQAAIVISRED